MSHLPSFKGLIVKDFYWRWPERNLAGNAIDFLVGLVLGLATLTFMFCSCPLGFRHSPQNTTPRAEKLVKAMTRLRRVRFQRDLADQGRIGNAAGGTDPFQVPRKRIR